jgi:hypothetical protein
LSSFRLIAAALAVSASALSASALSAQAPAEPARVRWERQCQIRKDKFEKILPRAMRENGVDMWIVMQKENQFDPMYEDLGRGYVGSVGYYIFTDRGGDRIERAAIGVSGYLLEQCKVYDIVRGFAPLKTFIAERNPKKIALNMSDEVGAADGLSKTSYDRLIKEIGPEYASRVVSAEKVVSDYRSGFTASQIVALGEAGEIDEPDAERHRRQVVVAGQRATAGTNRLGQMGAEQRVEQPGRLSGELDRLHADLCALELVELGEALGLDVAEEHLAGRLGYSADRRADHAGEVQQLVVAEQAAGQAEQFEHGHIVGGARRLVRRARRETRGAAQLHRSVEVESGAASQLGDREARARLQGAVAGKPGQVADAVGLDHRLDADTEFGQPPEQGSTAVGSG